MSIVKARLVVGHQDLSDSKFVEYHEWIIERSIKADKHGRPNPRVTYANWFKLVCNNPECPGFGFVNKEAVTGLLDEVTP